MCAGTGRGQGPDWVLSLGLSLSFPDRLCPLAPTHGHRIPTLTQPLPTFLHHWLRQAPAPGASEILGWYWHHSTKGVKARLAPAVL